MEPLLVWNQKQKQTIWWDTPLLEANRKLDLAQKGKRKLSDTYIVFGTPGSGKTTFLNVASLLGYKVLDFDPFQAFWHWFSSKSVKYDKLTIGQYTEAVNYWKLTSYTKTKKEAVEAFSTVIRHFDYVTSFLYDHHSYANFVSDESVSAILMLPDFQSYKTVLYHRDHDPFVNRSHEGNPVLSEMGLLTYNTNESSHIIRDIHLSISSPATSLWNTFVPLTHSYRLTEFKNALRLLAARYKNKKT